MTEDVVNTQIDARGIARVTLNKLSTHNALDEILIRDLHNAWLMLANNPKVRVVIIDANGKHFCAGADLHWMQRSVNFSEQQNYQDAYHLATMLHSLQTLNKPTIAQVQGAAMGGGAGLLACCDLVIASDQASFCFSEVKLGLIPATISPYVIAQIGRKAARRYFLTAERFDASTAQAIGLVDEVVPISELSTSTLSFADSLCHNGPDALAACKRLIEDITNCPLNDSLLQDTAKRIAKTRASDEAQMGLKAFFAKRDPDWRV